MATGSDTWSVIALGVFSDHDNNYIYTNDIVHIRLTKVPIPNADLTISFNGYSCTNQTLIEIDSEIDEIECKFSQGQLYGKTSCELIIHVANFGDVFISDELRENCVTHIPVIDDIVDNKVGTEGGAIIQIQGTLNGVELDKLTFRLSSEDLIVTDIQRENIYVKIPAKPAQVYNIEAFYDGLLIKQMILKVGKRILVKL